MTIVNLFGNMSSHVTQVQKFPQQSKQATNKNMNKE